MENRLEESSITELNQGFQKNSNSSRYECLFCSFYTEEGLIYSESPELPARDALSAIQQHVKSEHHGSFQSLLNLDKELSGISETQKTVLEGWFRDLSDQQIAQNLGGKSLSTVRNHRFNFKKRKIEAKILLSLMEMIEAKEVQKSEWVHYHMDMPLQDDRVKVTQAEAQQYVQKYYDSKKGILKSFPLKKQKIKLVLLKEISKSFQLGKNYSELEVNGILKSIFEDFVTLRRYLIDYAFLIRNQDGSIYKINPNLCI